MRINPFKTFFAIILLAVISLTAHADEKLTNSDEVLIILTASSVQTQGMALVLGNAMADQGASIHLLLCDGAGDLALKNHESTALKPRNITPVQMLQSLRNKGAEVKVCALFLPNSGYTSADLLDGITPASPIEMAKQMLNPAFRVFTF